MASPLLAAMSAFTTADVWATVSDFLSAPVIVAGIALSLGVVWVGRILRVFHKA